MAVAQRRSWFRPKLPFRFFAAEAAGQAVRKSSRHKLNIERMEERVTPTISLVNSPTWIQTGPGPIQNSPTVSGMLNQQTRSIGPIQAIATHPTDANIVYAGSTNGGVWRTVDAKVAGGNPTYVPLTDELPSLSITALALDPDNPSTLVAGMGALDSGGYDYRTPNGDLLGAYFTLNANAARPRWYILSNSIAGSTVFDVAVRGNFILVATSTGLFRGTYTVDPNDATRIVGGVTFNRIGTAGGLPAAGAVLDIAEDPGTRNRFYVTTTTGVFISNNGGTTFTNVTAANMGIGANTRSVKVSVHSTLFFNVVYVATANLIADGQTVVTNVVWSTNQGGAWTAMDVPKVLTPARPLPSIPNNPAPSNPADFGQITGDIVRLGSSNLGLATNSDGILVTGASRHGLVDGDWVRISGVTNYVDPTNTQQDNMRSLNGDWQVQVIDGAQFRLIGHNSSGSYNQGSRINPAAPFDPVTGNFSFQNNPGRNDGPANGAWVGGVWQKFIPLAIDGDDANILGQPGQPNTSSLHFAIAADTYNPNVVYISGDRGNRGIATSVSFDGGATTFPSNSTAYMTAIGSMTLRGDRSKPLASTAAGGRYSQSHRPYTNAAPRDVSTPSPNRQMFPQWVPFTGTNAGSLSSAPTYIPGNQPHNDSRIMVMDADGQLLQGNDGGLYRLTTANPTVVPLGSIDQTPPAGATAFFGQPTITGATWQAANGNMSIGQVYSVALDRNNNIIFAGFESNGVAFQSASNSTTWNASPFAPDQAFYVAVDNTSRPNTTIRYYTLSNLGTVIQDVFVGGVLTSRRALGSATIPIPPNSSFQPDTAFNSFGIIAVNNVDPRMIIMARTGIWEDSIVTNATTSTGDVFVNSAAPGTFNNPDTRVTAVVYGGTRNGVPSTRVAWYGTNTGEVWFRDELAGSVFRQVRPEDYDPLDPERTTVSSIAVDPADWRRAYIVSGNRILATTDAGLTWTNITGNLIGGAQGLSTQLRSIALWVPPVRSATLDDAVLLVSGRGGVYRFVPPSLGGDGLWRNFGPNIPNAIGTDIKVYGNTVIVGTYGRGVWKVDDISPFITADAELVVTGTADPDLVVVSQDPDNPLLVTVSITTNGVTETESFDKTTFKRLIINTLASADRIVVDSDGIIDDLVGDTRFVTFEINVDMGSDAGDQLDLDNWSTTAATQVTIDSTTIGGALGDNFFGLTGFLTYTGIEDGVINLFHGTGVNTTIINNSDVGTLNIFGNTNIDNFTVNGSGVGDAINLSGNNGADTFQVNGNAATLSIDMGAGNDVVAVQATTGVVSIFAGTGTETIRISSNALVAAVVPSGFLDGIQNDVFILGNGTSTNVLVSDFAADGSIGTLTNATITGFNMGAGRIVYQDVTNLNLDTSNSATPDAIIVESTAAGTTTNLTTNSGNDVINIRTTTGPLNANGGDGNDTFNISSDAGANLGVLSGIAGVVTIVGGVGSDTVTMSDFGASVSTGTINGALVTGFGMTGSVTSSGIEFLNVLSANNAATSDTLNITTTLAGVTTTVSANAGNDTINVANTAGIVFVNGGDGGDLITITNSGGTATINGDNGADRIILLNNAGNMSILGGADSDLIAIQRNTGTLLANGGSENDLFNISSTATDAGNGPNGVLSGLTGAVTINGGDAGPNLMFVSDLGATGSTGSVSATSILGFGMGASGIAYSNITLFQLDSSNSSTVGDNITVNSTISNGQSIINGNNGNDTVTVISASGNTFVVAGDGNDTTNVRGVTAGATLTVTPGNGTDVVNISSDAPANLGTLANILGTVNVNGSGTGDTVNVSSFGAPATPAANVNGFINPTSITGFGLTGNINFTAINTLNVSTSNAGNDNITVNGTFNGVTNIIGNGGDDIFNIAGNQLQGVLTVDGAAGNDLFNVNVLDGITATAVAIVGGANTGTGQDRVVFNGRLTDDNIAVTLGNPTTSVAGLGGTVTYNTLEDAFFNGNGGNDNFSLTDGSNTSFGSRSNPSSGVVYRPTGSTSGDFRFNMASTGISATPSITPNIRFAAINGNVFYNGDLDGSGDKDALVVLAPSTTGAQSTGIFGEATTANGADTITITETNVTINNFGGTVFKGIGMLPSGLDSLFVRGGNESTARGDTFIVTPTNKFFMYVDGMNPQFVSPGDTLSVNTIGNRTNTPVTDPALGPPHRRITQTSDGASVDYINFENLAGSSSLLAVGSDAGSIPRVQVFNPGTGQLIRELQPYGSGFRGGVRVAVGDVTGDGIPDVVTATGPGAPPDIRVFDGVTFQQVRQFFAFGRGYVGGSSISAFDMNVDGYADIIVGTSAAVPQVKVFDGQTGAETRSFMAFNQTSTFSGGVTVAAGDVDGDGVPDIVASAGAGAPPLVRAFRYTDMTLVREFLAYGAGFRGGVTVAVADLNGDFIAEVIAGSGTGATGDVRVFNATTTTPTLLGRVNVSNLSGNGVPIQTSTRVTVTDLGNTGVPKVLVARGQGTFPVVRSFRLTNGSTTMTETDTLNAFEPSFGFGIFLGGR